MPGLTVKGLTFLSSKVDREYRLALLADVHDCLPPDVLPHVRAFSPSLIAVNGDLVNNYLTDWILTPKDRLKNLLRGSRDTHYDGHIASSYSGSSVLQECASISTTFYSLGNHERYFTSADAAAVHSAGAVLLENEFLPFGGLCIGAQSSFELGQISEERIADGDLDPILVKRRGRAYAPEAETAWLDEFERQPGFKVLLCHHPEYYDKFLRHRDIDLILSGHAHGGQIRLFGRGLYAPDQGVLPRYTSGVIDNRMVISRGLSNQYRFVPRFNNAPELVLITVKPE